METKETSALPLLLDHPDLGFLLRLTEAVPNGQGTQRDKRWAFFIRGWATQADRDRLLAIRVRCPCCGAGTCPVTVMGAPLTTGRVRVPKGAMSVKFTCGYHAGGFGCARRSLVVAPIRDEFYRRLLGAPAAPPNSLF